MNSQNIDKATMVLHNCNQNNRPILPAYTCFARRNSPAIDKPQLTIFQTGRLWEPCQGNPHKRPPDLSEDLSDKREIQGIGLSVKELHAHLPAGSCPGFFCFPKVGVETCHWIITERARSGSRGLLDRVDRI